MNALPSHILHIITGLSDGGAEAVLYRLVTHDKQNRHTVISLMDNGKYGVLLQAAHIDVFCLNMRPSRLTFKGLIQLWCMLHRIKPDVVQTWMYHADLIGGVCARLTGIRRVVWGIHHTTLVAGKSKRSTRVIATLCAWLSGVIPRRIVCCADTAAQVHQALGYAAQKLIVIANGYDLSQFAPNPAAGSALRQALQLPDDCFLVGMVARYDPQKDHANLLAALAVFKQQSQSPFRCVLVGKGLTADNADLQHALAQHGLQDEVILLGTRNDIPAVMNALNVHVLASAYGEAFPNVLSEAMACGTPCVATDVGDAARIVADYGWIVPPHQASALAAALHAAWRASKDGAAWQQCRVACQQHIAAHFSLERMVAGYCEVWRETLAENQT